MQGDKPNVIGIVMQWTKERKRKIINKIRLNLFVKANLSTIWRIDSTVHKTATHRKKDADRQRYKQTKKQRNKVIEKQGNRKTTKI